MSVESLNKTRRGLITLPVLLAACASRSAPPIDQPRIATGVKMQDVVFYSASLNRDMPYRVFLPEDFEAAEMLPVVYLLHGNGGGFRDWSNYSDVASLMHDRRRILVMPEGGSSYYTNAVDRPQDRYEDYIISDLFSDVDRRFHAAPIRAIIGVSMGGYGAIKLALRYPGKFVFAAGLSPAIDVPRRRFSLRYSAQWRDHAAIFGPQDARQQNDPFVLARSADPAQIPFLYIWCGEQEGLLQPNREFAAILATRRFHYQFRATPGKHDWTSWNYALADCIQQLKQHFP